MISKPLITQEETKKLLTQVSEVPQIQATLKSMLQANEKKQLENYSKIKRKTNLYIDIEIKISNYIPGKLLILDNYIYILPPNPHFGPTITNIHSDELKKILLCLNLDLVTLSLIVHKQKYKFRLYVLGYSQPGKFRFPELKTNDLFLKCIELLQLSILESKGHLTNLIGVCGRKDFLSRQFITPKAFIDSANTGDILIFRGKECCSNCQRGFTRAEYDHVGYIINNQKSIYIYDATGKDGVKGRDWRQYIYNFWNVGFDKITYRKLIISTENPVKTREELQEKTKEFINLTQKKKYRGTRFGICCANNEDEHEKNNDWSKTKGFFCSQLVAAAYNHCGIMPYETDSRHYLPGSFSMKGNIRLNAGFNLGPEKIMDFTS